MIRENPDICEVKEIGIIVAFEPAGWSSDRDPDCDVWTDAIVLWPSFGISWHMKALLEVIHESR
jgi:hypothetical protein